MRYADIVIKSSSIFTAETLDTIEGAVVTPALQDVGVFGWAAEEEAALPRRCVGLSLPVVVAGGARARTVDGADRSGHDGLHPGLLRRGRDLDLGDIDPALTMYPTSDGGVRESVEVELPRFDGVDGKVAHERRGVPVRAVVTSRWNVKITYLEDLARAEAWLAAEGRR